MKLAIAVILSSIFLCQFTAARFAPYYSYEDLMKMSDLVVIMEHESTQVSKEIDPESGNGRVTTAKVLFAFKGKVTAEKIRIYHIYYPMLPSAPNPIVFLPSDASGIRMRRSSPDSHATFFIVPSRQYIAFLKRQSDGTYIPATPQFDSNLSFLTIGGSTNVLWSLSMEDTSIKPSNHKQPKTLTFDEVPTK